MTQFTWNRFLEMMYTSNDTGLKKSIIPVLIEKSSILGLHKTKLVFMESF